MAPPCAKVRKAGTRNTPPPNQELVYFNGLGSGAEESNTGTCKKRSRLRQGLKVCENDFERMQVRENSKQSLEYLVEDRVRT